MKRFMLIWLYFSLSIACLAQKKNLRNPANLDSVYFDIMPKTFAPSDIKFPFGEIEISDERFDTSKLGFMFFRRDADVDFKDFRKIKLWNGIENSLQKFYNYYYQKSLQKTENKLLIVVKKLWIDNLPNRQLGNGKYDIERNAIQDIHVKFEFYLHSGQDYYPLIRMDTTYQLTEENIANPILTFSKTDLSFFVYTLKSLLEKSDFQRLIEKISYSRKYTLAQIDSFNRKRFDIPILKDSNVAEGMFMTFKEFLDNKPSVTNYMFTQKGILKIDGNATPNNHYWAFYDKNGLHIGPSKKINIWRIGNTYEFFIVDELYLKKTVIGNILFMLPDPGGVNSPTPSSGVKVKKVDSPKQIDMETGLIY